MTTARYERESAALGQRLIKFRRLNVDFKTRLELGVSFDRFVTPSRLRPRERLAAKVVAQNVTKNIMTFDELSEIRAD